MKVKTDEVGWAILIGLFLLLGLVFFFLELETDEIEYFGFISIGLLITAAILWFYSSSAVFTLGSNLVLIISVILVTIPVLIVVFTIFLIKKVQGSLKNPEISNLNLIGKEGVCAEPIGEDGIGYIKYKSELWRAKSDQIINRGEKVRVLDQDQLDVVVEPVCPGSMFCPQCGSKFKRGSKICVRCGYDLTGIE